MKKFENKINLYGPKKFLTIGKKVKIKYIPPKIPKLNSIEIKPQRKEGWTFLKKPFLNFLMEYTPPIRKMREKNVPT